MTEMRFWGSNTHFSRRDTHLFLKIDSLSNLTFPLEKKMDVKGKKMGILPQKPYFCVFGVIQPFFHEHRPFFLSLVNLSYDSSFPL